MNKEFNMCQSCGKILKSDNTSHEIDGSESVYCTACYDGIKFIQDITLEEMQIIVSESIKDKHIPNFVKNRIVEGIPNLLRWKE